MRYVFSFVLAFLVPTVFGVAAESPDPQAIVDRAIEVHGGDRFERSTIRFEFRGVEFEIWRDGGEYRYERRISKDGREIRDIVTNDGFYREADGRRIDLEPRARARAFEAVNSVPYFALLPYRLNDPSVVKKYDGRTEIKGEPYHRIHVTFRDTEGVTDPENEFLFWFHETTGELDYFAYTSGGNRFREVLETNEDSGIRLNDYINYRSEPVDRPLRDVEKLFEQGKLIEVSRIELDDLAVELH